MEIPQINQVIRPNCQMEVAFKMGSTPQSSKIRPLMTILVSKPMGVTSHFKNPLYQTSQINNHRGLEGPPVMSSESAFRC